jgi:hypothetical protein
VDRGETENDRQDGQGRPAQEAPSRQAFLQNRHQARIADLPDG